MVLVEVLTEVVGAAVCFALPPEQLASIPATTARSTGTPTPFDITVSMTRRRSVQYSGEHA